MHPAKGCDTIRPHNVRVGNDPHRKALMFIGGGLLVLILDIFCILQVMQTSMDPTKKLLWVLVILLLPVLGPILWLLIGRGR